MDLINKNKHLNIFNYYRLEKNTPKENNLSRAFTITLDKNKEFLNRIIKKFIFNEVYSSIFSIDYSLINEDQIYINIQTKDFQNLSSEKIKDYYNEYFGILLGNFEKEFINEKEINKIDPADTDSPIPDILIGINDILIVIENKLDGDIGDIPQLKRHVESIAGEGKQNIKYKAINWSSIIRDAIDLYYQDNENYPFLEDFIQFIRREYTSMMPIVPLKDIKVDDKEIEKDKITLINQRLDVVKTIVAKNHFYEDSLMEERSNLAIPLDFGWTDRAHLTFDENDKSLLVEMWPGLKGSQAEDLFEDKDKLKWLERDELNVKENIYNLKIRPYIRFASSFGSGIEDIDDLLMKDENFKKTHITEVFNKLTRRWKTGYEKFNWVYLENYLDELVGKDWRSDVDWKNKFIESGRTTIDISLGAKVEVEIPYSKAQKLDNDKDDPKLAKEIYDILTKLKEIIDQ